MALYLEVVREFAATALGAPVRSLDIQLFTQAKALVYYTMLTFMPVKLSIDHQFLAADSGMASPPVVAALAFVVSLGGIVLARSRVTVMQTVLLPAVWAGLVLLPTIIVPLNVLVNEHRLYLPLAFAAIALGACILCFALMSNARNAAWESNQTIWTDALTKGPLMFRAHQELGGMHESRGELDRALKRYEIASRLAPHVPETHYNRGNALRMLGRTPEAEQAYRLCQETSGNTFVPALVNLSTLVRTGGRADESLVLLERARGLEPENPDVWLGLGILYKERGQIAAAQEAFERALEIAPASAATHYSLANLNRHERKLDAAVHHYRAALAIDEQMHDARVNLSLLYVEMGRYRQAATLSAAALQRWPEVVRLHYALARAQDGLGLTSAAIGNYRRYLPEAPTPAMREFVNRKIERLQGSN